MEPECFACNALGYLRHWLIVGPQRTAYAGPGGDDDFIRRSAAEARIVQPPREAAPGAPGPFGQAWRFYDPGENFFVECSAFYHQLTTLDSYAATEVHVQRDVSPQARFWVSGTADLWVNDDHVCRYDMPRYMYPGSTQVVLPLKRGVNRLCVRLQGLGLRDTRTLFGLQFLDGGKEIAVRLPGPAELTAQLVRAERWLEGITATGRDALICRHPAPAGAEVTIGPPPGTGGSTRIPWPAGQTRVIFPPDGAMALAVALEVAGQKLERAFEIPANRAAPPQAGPSLDEHRRSHVEHIAAGTGRGMGDVLQVLARRMLGRRSELDSPVLDEAIRAIDGRKDCADFTLAMLLRMVALALAGEAEARRVRQAAMGFRYWMDEPGTDAMCFGSENHRLLFHGCQLLAGRLFAEERFTNSGRTGAEQASIASRRCLEWLDGIERDGFREFLSSSYMPITMAALMNLVDFAGDEGVSRRAAALVDRIFSDLAMHAFDGVTVGPQGRVYRNVLYPQTSGTQGLLSFATTEAVVAWCGWIVFVASSPSYRPPDRLGELMRRPVSKRYRQAEVEICIHKTGDYLLTSLQVPASFDDEVRKGGGLRPGNPGYQQHLWHATLGRDCHVFVNHPGASFDFSMSRPGYWYGNGCLPRLSQRDGMILAVFDIPEEHPIHFTHAHWPSDAFEREERRDHWAFGAKGAGRIALWCSEPLLPHNEVLTGRELRAWGRRAAWMCLCAGAAESGGFDAFVRSCLALNPGFDAEGMRIHLRQGA